MPRPQKVIRFDPFSQRAPVNAEEAAQRSYHISQRAAKAHVEGRDRIQELSAHVLAAIEEKILTEAPDLETLVKAAKVLLPYTQVQLPKTLKVEGHEKDEATPEARRAELAAYVTLLSPAERKDFARLLLAEAPLEIEAGTPSDEET